MDPRRAAAASVAVVALTAGCGAGGPGGESASRSGDQGTFDPLGTSSPSASASATASPTSVPDPLVLRSDFTSNRNPGGWPVSSDREADRAVRDGTYRVDTSGADDAFLAPRPIRRVVANQVSIGLDVTELEGDEPQYGIACMGGLDVSTNRLSSTYLVVVQTRGKVAVAGAYRSEASGKYVPVGRPARVSGWNPDRPGALTFTCRRSAGAARLGITDDNGVSVLDVVDRDPLPAGVTYVYAFTPGGGHLSVRGIGVTLRGTARLD